MKSTLIQDGDNKTFALVFEPGEEVAVGLLRFAKEKNLPGAHLTAIGAFERVTSGSARITPTPSVGGKRWARRSILTAWQSNTFMRRRASPESRLGGEDRRNRSPSSSTSSLTPLPPSLWSSPHRDPTEERLRA